MEFQLTAPLREPTVLTLSLQPTRRSFNSRLPCGSRLGTTRQRVARSSVSTHGSLAGADIRGNQLLSGTDVSTHGSLAGADHRQSSNRTVQPLFQLTAPLREPTSRSCATISLILVSTHGSLAGADMTSYAYSKTHARFNSRLPCGSRLVGIFLRKT